MWCGIPRLAPADQLPTHKKGAKSDDSLGFRPNHGDSANWYQQNALYSIQQRAGLFPKHCSI
jgi:hypothetical protein